MTGAGRPRRMEGREDRAAAREDQWPAGCRACGGPGGQDGTAAGRGLGRVVVAGRTQTDPCGSVGAGTWEGSRASAERADKVGHLRDRRDQPGCEVGVLWGVALKQELKL